MKEIEDMMSSYENRQNAHKLIELLEKSGYEGYMVGGCVRDMIMGREYNDIDIATSATPEECKAVFLGAGYRIFETGIKHGTVSVLCGGGVYEITTYRIDGSYTDCRHPDSVEFTRDIILDLSRRDFTVNAMAMDKWGEVIDPFSGRKDIADGVIRCVGEPRERFREDALRILRAMRFASVLGFEIDEHTKKGMETCSSLIPNVAGERVYCELGKAIVGKDSAKIFHACFDVIKWSLYPAKAEKSLEMFDFEKFAKCFDGLIKAPALRFAALLCLVSDDAHHASLLGEGFIKRMKCEKEVCRSVGYLISRVFSPLPATKGEINREMIKNGEKNVIMLIQLANFLSELGVLDECHYYGKTESIAREIVEGGGCITVKGLAVNGGHLIELGVERCPEMGRLLDHLVDLVAEGRVENTKEELIAAVRDYFDKNNKIQ